MVVFRIDNIPLRVMFLYQRFTFSFKYYETEKKGGNGMKSVLGRMALSLVVACAILAVSALTAESGDKVVEEIKAAYAENVEVTVTPKIECKTSECESGQGYNGCFE
jgi:hypothetical protein